ncbi:ABC transporter substrate-binding protein [Streptomyces sp. TLI_171]|uniref:ABC transporter substrate-binding protein n=1 Tax=Streptomyces sp. TLI_171 TaxID=1938859 RepID=UPI000C176620|nr:ABC transporter substrate-binding protein [Streptomyces sp. TLI_171]RKE17823.1 ABC-type glycerol-3-phosphate transport system substrate-binding protein [Streptomyces sp. TLI_171]
MRRGWVAVAAATMVVLTACSSNGGGSASSVPTVNSDPTKVTGTITVLTNRTDQLGDGTLDKYAAEFNKTYPNVKVKFEGMKDYEGEVKIRMNTENYGDVLPIPSDLSIAQFPTFFSPLGDSAELSKQYQWTDYATVSGKVYGIANYGTVTGFVYNKKVWADAGVTAWPKTPEEFLADLKAIKAKGQATPYYTNYHDGWPLRQWTDAIGSPSCNPGAKDAMATTATPWTAGNDLHTIDSLVYSIVNQKLSEDDPTTTNWDNSKTLLGTGKIGSMYLGSWSVSQMRDAAAKAGASADDIGYMPFPSTTGKPCTVLQPDYKYAINKHSKSQEAARAWIDWYINKSGSAQNEQGISSVKGAELPSTLKPFTEQGVQMIGQNQEKLATVKKIDKGAEINLDAPDYRQKLVDIARGAASGDQNSYFAELNKKWSESQKTVG